MKNRCYMNETIHVQKLDEESEKSRSNGSTVYTIYKKYN